MSNTTVSGMPSSAEPLPGTTKKFVQFMFAFMIVTLQVTNCRIFVYCCLIISF